MPYSFPGIPFDGPPIDGPSTGGSPEQIVSGRCTTTITVEDCTQSSSNSCGGTFSINEVGSYGSVYGLNYGYGSISPNGNFTVNSSAYCPGYFAFMVVSTTCSDGSIRILDSFVSAGIDSNGRCPASDYSRQFSGICCPSPSTTCTSRDLDVTIPITAGVTGISYERLLYNSRNPGFLQNINNLVANLGRTLEPAVFRELETSLNSLPPDLKRLFTINPNGPDGRPVIQMINNIDDYLRIIGREVTQANRAAYATRFGSERAALINNLLNTLQRPIGGTPGFDLLPGAGNRGGYGLVPRPLPPAGGGGIFRAILRGGGNIIRAIIGIGGAASGMIEIIPVLDLPLQLPGGQRMDCAFNFSPSDPGGQVSLLGDSGISTMPTAILASNQSPISSQITNNLLIRANEGSPYSTFPVAMSPNSEYL